MSKTASDNESSAPEPDSESDGKQRPRSRYEDLLALRNSRAKELMVRIQQRIAERDTSVNWLLRVRGSDVEDHARKGVVIRIESLLIQAGLGCDSSTARPNNEGRLTGFGMSANRRSLTGQLRQT